MLNMLMHAEEDFSAYAELLLNFVRCADIYQIMLNFVRYLHDDFQIKES